MASILTEEDEGREPREESPPHDPCIRDFALVQEHEWLIVCLENKRFVV